MFPEILRNFYRVCFINSSRNFHQEFSGNSFKDSSNINSSRTFIRSSCKEGFLETSLKVFLLQFFQAPDFYSDSLEFSRDFSRDWFRNLSMVSYRMVFCMDSSRLIKTFHSRFLFINFLRVSFKNILRNVFKIFSKECFR